MITKVTKDNKGLYKTLFTQAGIALNQGPDAISSLDEYFACFKSLADLDAVFAVLPLDEPTFDIDAKGEIIPINFKSNLDWHSEITTDSKDEWIKFQPSVKKAKILGKEI